MIQLSSEVPREEPSFFPMPITSHGMLFQRTSLPTGSTPGIRFSTISMPITQTGAALFKDRKSTRLNSSHVSISYAVFCLKKKKKKLTQRERRGRASQRRFDGARPNALHDIRAVRGL